MLQNDPRRLRPAIECDGCGRELDPRDFSRNNGTRGGYCGLVCKMRDANRREKTDV